MSISQAAFEGLIQRYLGSQSQLAAAIDAINGLLNALPSATTHPAIIAARKVIAAQESADLVTYGDCSAASVNHTADSAPAVQPCGHPWKAQHDFKCILCSSAGPAL